MNPVSEIKTAAASAFTFKNILYGMGTVFAVLLIANVVGLTDALLRPWDTAKAAWEKNKAAK